MNHIHRTLAALATLAGALLALAAAPAALASPLRPPPHSYGGGAPAPVRVIVEGGMAGWQITLIAAGAALAAAALAVLLDRTLAARKAHATTT
jgi:hypothetical protein